MRSAAGVYECDDGEMPTIAGIPPPFPEAARCQENGTENFDFLLEQAPRRTREECWWTHYRRMGAMGNAKGIVDIGIKPTDQFGDQCGIICGFSRIEAQILHDFNTGH